MGGFNLAALVGLTVLKGFLGCQRKLALVSNFLLGLMALVAAKDEG